MLYIIIIPNIVKITHDDIFKEPAEKSYFGDQRSNLVFKVGHLRLIKGNFQPVSGLAFFIFILKIVKHIFLSFLACTWSFF